MRRDKNGGCDNRDVQQHRSERGDREPAIDIHHAAGERYQRHEQHIREHDPYQHRGQLDFARRSHEAAGQQVDQPGCGDDAEYRYDNQGHRQDRSDFSDQIAGRGLAARAFVLGKDRYECLRERAFGKHAAEDVRQAKRRFEGIHLQSGAETTALMLSRISPVMRESKVSALTAESVLSRFMRGPVTLAGEASARPAICGHGARMRSHF